MIVTLSRFDSEIVSGIVVVLECLLFGNGESSVCDGVLIGDLLERTHAKPARTMAWKESDVNGTGLDCVFES